MTKRLTIFHVSPARSCYAAAMKTLNLQLGLLTSVSAAILLSGCATTNLASRTPIDIASNSVRHTDNKSGISAVLAPSVRAFSKRRKDISGKARLLTANTFTDDKGSLQSGGAYLDVVINYATFSPDPAETRRYDSAAWAGGEAALVAEYGEAVIECREDIREDFIPSGYNYYDSYYGHGSDYGYGYGNSSYGYGYGYSGGRGGSHGGGGSGSDNDDDSDDGVSTMPSPDTGNTTSAPPTPNMRRRPRPGPPRTRPAPQPDGPGTEPGINVRPVMGQRPAPQATSARPRPTPRRITPKPSSSKPASSSSSRPTSSRVFSSTSNRRTTPARTTRREMRYYPRQQHTSRRNISIRYSCIRQENLRVFIPKDRVDAAETGGLLLYLQPKRGRAEALVLPTNYISGFKLAAYSPEGPNLTIQGSPVAIRKRPAAIATPLAKEPDASVPIIYGEK